MRRDKVAGLLGLCARAGQLASGESGCEAALRAGQAALVLLDAEASANTRKRFTDGCAYRQVPLYTLEAGMLGQAIGKPNRMAAAVKAGNLAGQLQAQLEADSI